MSDIRLHPDWLAALRPEFDSDYMATLKAFLAEERRAGPVFPAPADWFRALDLTPPGKVRVVILGQDPYHGDGQAHGLSFSVPAGVKPPPSLANIFREMESDLGIPRANHGTLDHWAQQGVLLLNSVLTVRRGAAASHQKRGWEQFTDAIIRHVAAEPRPIVFILWGAYAQRKAGFVEAAGGGRHCILRSAHPSPLAAHNGFFGSRPFSRANAFLVAHGQPPIDWALPPA